MAFEKHERRAESDRLEDFRRDLVHSDLSVDSLQVALENGLERQPRLASYRFADRVSNRAVVVEDVGATLRTKRCLGAREEFVPRFAVDPSLFRPFDVGGNAMGRANFLHLHTDLELLASELAVPVRKGPSAIRDDERAA